MSDLLRPGEIARPAGPAGRHRREGAGHHPTSGIIDKPAELAPAAGDPARLECFIPTLCVQNHASFIAELPGGDLGCVWFGGTQEGIPDISVYFSRLKRGATRWTEARKLSDDPTRSEQNPLLFTAPDGALWLLWTAQIGGNQDTALVRRRISRDGGLFGSEEREQIIPAIQAARAKDIDAQGPYAPDTFFAKANSGVYDICVAMYHDQGHIPVKLLGFTVNPETGTWDALSGVNITLGLPIIRTSVDHGTAFDIAGRGIASETSLLEAIDFAIRLAATR
jgi:hypothetical protein